VILIVSHPGDDHSIGVSAELERASKPYLLLDTSRFPIEATLSQRFGPEGRTFELCVDGESHDLSQSRVGWWRRPQPLRLHDGLAPNVIGFTYAECHEAIAGMWAALGLRWVNPPDLDELAHHKPYQLAVAAEIGLAIPRTLITNCPVDARTFAQELGPDATVYKTFLATEQHWRETRLLRMDEVDLLDRVRLAPVIFQEFVPAAADIRVTVMGERMFATAIRTAPGAYDVDYRMDIAGARFEVTELLDETAKKIRELMRRLGLTYGAIDLRRTPAGEEVFLEVNPAGEWLFVEERTGQPMTRSMAELLTELDQTD
jgi:hypothetical protein